MKVFANEDAWKSGLRTRSEGVAFDYEILKQL